MKWLIVLTATLLSTALLFAQIETLFDLRDYYHLSPEQREELSRLFYQTGMPKTNGKVKLHPLSDPLLMELNRTIANTLRTTFTQDYIVGVGQTCSYLIYTASIMEQIDGGRSRFDYIAFSGKWRNPRPCRGICQPPTKTQIDHYRIYLQSQQLSPLQIIQRHRAEQQRTIMFDYSTNGQSLRSFLSIMHDWAQELQCLGKLQYALHYFVLQNPEKKTKYDQCLGFSVEAYDSSYHDASLFHRFTKACDSQRFGERLVPRFEPPQWETMDPHTFQENENARLILFAITDYLVNNNHRAG